MVLAFLLSLVHKLKVREYLYRYEPYTKSLCISKKYEKLENVYNKYYEGVLYNPDLKNCKIIATLFINEKGEAVISSLQNLRNDNLMSFKTISAVYGYISDIENSKIYSIKLFDVDQKLESISALNKYKYISNQVYISDGYDKNICDSEMYKTLMLTSEKFENWIKITGFNIEFKDYKNFELCHYYKQPKKIVLFENSELLIYIFFRASTNLIIKRTSNITEEVFLNVEFKNPLERKNLIEIRKKIDRLMSLFLDTPVVSKLEIQTTKGMVYKLLKIDKDYTSNAFRNIIDFEYFIKNSQVIFKNWFKKQDELDLLIKNYFSIFGRKGVLIENRFITYISILENYYKNKYKTKKTLKNVLTKIFTNSAVNNKIENITEYIETLKTTRNYLVHLEEKHKSNSLSSEGILVVNKVLEFVIRELLLRELGINILDECKFCSYEIIKN